MYKFSGVNKQTDTGYIQDSPERSVSFGYSQDNGNQ